MPRLACRPDAHYQNPHRMYTYLSYSPHTKKVHTYTCSNESILQLTPPPTPSTTPRTLLLPIHPLRMKKASVPTLHPKVATIYIYLHTFGNNPGNHPTIACPDSALPCLALSLDGSLHTYSGFALPHIYISGFYLVLPYFFFPIYLPRSQFEM